MKTDKLFYQIFINQQSLIHELLPDIPSDCQFEYTAPVVKETEFRLDGVFTPLSDDPNVPLIFLEAQMQKDVKFYRRYFGEIFLYLSQYEETRTWKGLLILKNKNHDLGSEIPYKILLDNNITRLYLEDLLTTENLSPNLALLKLIVVKNSEITNLGKLVLNSAKTEDEFQRQFTLIEAILKSKLPQLSTEEILMMFDLKTATMPKLDAYETLVKYWQDKAKEEGLQEGRQEGRQEGGANLLIRQLIGRFGNITENQREKVRSLSIPELESLGEALLDFQGMSDLESWFQSKNHENG
jgi:predicted transposase/invertase (TIGR01784 family)